MDPLTHALSGALLVSAFTRRSRQTIQPDHHQPLPPTLPLRLKIATGFAAAAFPDIDFALRLIDTLVYLNWHQGPTHSLILLPLWAWLLAQCFAQLFRQYAWQLFFIPACLGLAIHIAGDLMTSYGLMLFAPFSTERYSFPLIFVIDLWFSLIIIAGLATSWFYPLQRTTAMAALAGLGIYVFFVSTLYHQAIAVAQHYVKANALHQATVSVLPQPLSPFHWKLIIQHNDNYHVAQVRLRKTAPLSGHETATTIGPWRKIMAAYRPVTENAWIDYHQFGDDPHRRDVIRSAWNAPAFEPFRTFSIFPVLERVEENNRRLCYWFYDLRFEFPQLPPSFRYGICRQEGETGWRMLRQRGLFYID